MKIIILVGGGGGGVTDPWWSRSNEQGAAYDAMAWPNLDFFVTLNSLNGKLKITYVGVAFESTNMLYNLWNIVRMIFWFK